MFVCHLVFVCLYCWNSAAYLDLVINYTNEQVNLLFQIKVQPEALPQYKLLHSSKDQHLQ